MRKKSSKKNLGGTVTKTELGGLLTQQTATILHAMDERFTAQDKHIDERFTAQDKHIEKQFIAQNIALSAELDKRFAESDKRFTEALNRLTNTIDKLLKRAVDLEEEFTFMKADLNRVKAVLREKLGVTLH